MSARSLIAAAVLAFPATMLAEDKAAAPTVFKGHVLSDGTLDKSGDVKPNASLQAGPGGARIDIACDAKQDCTKLSVRLGAKAFGPPKDATAKATSFGPVKTFGAAQLVMQGVKDPLAAFNLQQEAAAEPEVKDGGRGGEPPPDLTTLTPAQLLDLSARCPIGPVPAAAYDARANFARVKVRPNGNPLSPLTSDFDEDDSLEVNVRIDRRLRPFLKIVRSSGFRTVGDYAVLGEGEKIPSTLTKQAGGGAAVPDCVDYVTTLRDFAPGKGSVDILVTTGGNETKVGSFEFAVHKLYNGMFSLGLAWSQAKVRDRTFGTIGPSGTITEATTSDATWALFFTPFIWGKRDFEKGTLEFYHHVNPTVGISLTDTAHNAFAGLSADFIDGLVVTGGWHIAQIPELDPNSNLSVGQPLPAGFSGVPTAKRWRGDWFVAVSVDLRAAVKLFKAVGSAAP
jgi:hypothetical protein